MLLAAADLQRHVVHGRATKPASSRFAGRLRAVRRKVLRLVLRGAFELALGGTAFGALLDLLGLGQVNTDLVLFGGEEYRSDFFEVIAELTLLVVTMLASIVPAVRAMPG